MRKKKAKSFYNLIPDWSPDHFCHILFFRDNSVSPARAQGEGTARGCGYVEVGVLRVLLEAAYNTGLFSSSFILLSE